MPRTESPSIHDDSAVERWRRRHRWDPHSIRRLRHFLLREYRSLDDACSALPVDFVSSLRRAFGWSEFSVVQRQDSQQDGASKLVLQTRDEKRVEMVLMRARTGRTTACVSSQVGCGAGCPFCATGDLGLTRSLSATEILEQVRLAGQITRQEQRQLRNIVFMGMGEPLDNEPAVYSAIEQLVDPNRFAIPARRIILSTVGIPDAMVRFVDRYPEIQFALSLHSARPEIRARLIPWSRRHDWQQLQDALRYVVARRPLRPKQSPTMVEYLMLDGINDTDEDADALIEYLAGIPAHINLIPYNATPGRPWRATPRERRDAFATRLRQAGFFTTIRFSMGNDIAAACGQLAGN